MNRQQRRAAKFGRRQTSEPETIRTLNPAELLRLAAAIVAADGSVSGVTVISPDGELSYVDAETRCGAAVAGHERVSSGR